MESETRAERSWAFGLILIGDEILTGHRQDAHFPHFRETLRERGHGLAWCWILPDERAILVAHLARARAEGRPVFCCGGIGATPDDLTRDCAAEAAGVPLERHGEAAAEIEARFGAAAHPHRILMADLPRGSRLIPNPYNRVPGFSLDQQHFLPGFPEMAWPMADWVLDQYYPGRPPPLRACALRVERAAESALIPLMRELSARYPRLKLFSLPRLTEPRAVELGFRGRDGLEEAWADLRRELNAGGFAFTELEPPAPPPV